MFFADASISIHGPGDVRVRGFADVYVPRIEGFVEGLGLQKGRIVYRGGRWHFSRDVPPGLHQRIRNFLTNECPPAAAQDGGAGPHAPQDALPPFLRGAGWIFLLLALLAILRLLVASW